MLNIMVQCLVVELKTVCKTLSFATIPTMDIVTEAGVSSILDYVVNKRYKHNICGSIKDNLIHGITPGSVKGGVIGRLVHDFTTEGMEEVLQDYTQHLTSAYMAEKHAEFGNNPGIYKH